MSLHWTDLLASLYSWICTFPPALVLRSSLPTASIGAWTLIIDENNSVMSLDHCWLSFKLIVFMLKVNFHTYSKGTHILPVSGADPLGRGVTWVTGQSPLWGNSLTMTSQLFGQSQWVESTKLDIILTNGQPWFDSAHDLTADTALHSSLPKTLQSFLWHPMGEGLDPWLF